jgi:hypothetical protein
MGRPFKALLLAGIFLISIGILGFAVPYFTTDENHDVLAVGDMKIQATESTGHVVPPALSGSAVVVGVILLTLGLSRRARV